MVPHWSSLIDSQSNFEKIIFETASPQNLVLCDVLIVSIAVGRGSAHGCVPKHQPKKKLEKAETQMANVWAVLPGTSALVTGSVSH